MLQLISSGKTDREIRVELFISVKTVGNHVSTILNKTSAANRTEAGSYANQKGLVTSSVTRTTNPCFRWSSTLEPVSESRALMRSRRLK